MDEKHVANSGQGNYYGALTLVNRDLEFYLKMQDYDGDDLTGPLTMEQVEAFCILFEVDVAEVLK